MKYLVLFILSFNIWAQDIPTIAIGDAELEKDRILFEISNNTAPSDQSTAKKIIKILKDDFLFYKHKYEIIPKLPEGIKKTEYFKLRESGFRYIVDITLKSDKEGFTISGAVHDSHDEEATVINTKVVRKDFRRNVHKLADLVFKKISTKESIFTTQIVFVSDFLTTKKVRVKEVYLMDFDGGNKKKITNHRGLVVSPAINHAGDKVVYSLIKETAGRRNVDLYMKNLITGKTSVVSSRYGINSGAVFSRDDKHIYLTLSTKGNTDIFKLNLATKKTVKLTKHYGEDVDPSVSSDGSTLAFLSSRPGKASIYTLDIKGDKPKNLKRISYVGKFNATPRFSPDAKEIAFSSWLDNRFDIFKINTLGTGLVRLTKNFGSNEDPSFSKDGEFIVFSSQVVLTRKTAIQNIYIMNRFGEIVKKITSRFGHCQSPRWSK
jgi:TolB protein